MKSRRLLAGTPALVVDEQYLSFGEVWEDPAFVRILPIHNTTDENIEIDGFATSCSCGKVEPSSITVPAHGTVEAHLILDLRSPHREPDLKAKDFAVHIQPQISKGSGRQPRWVVQGKVMQPFAIEPPVVDFEESLVRGQPFASCSVLIACGLDVAELTAHCDSSFLTVKVARGAKDRRQFHLEVQPLPNMPGGRFDFLVRITALTPSKQEVSGAVPVIGGVLEDVVLQPEFVTGGAEPIGAKIQETITLQSRSGKEFAIQEIDKGENDGITVDVDHKRKDVSQSLIVSFPVKRLGHQEYTIHIKVKTPEGLMDLPLRMSCYGIPAQAAAAAK
jgi:hypothetical protein